MIAPANTVAPPRQRLDPLLAGRPDDVRALLAQAPGRQVTFLVLLIVAGAGLYGATMGAWRSPLQAGLNLLKFPLIILATTLGNALLNGMLAPLLGMDLRFRDSLRLVLMSFAIAAAVLGAFAPLNAFLVWNVPSLDAPATPSWQIYRFVQLMQVLTIAFAGTVANVRLLQTLESISPAPRAARRVLFAWLAGNLFFGSQLCWMLRPLIGRPNAPVEFLRPDALSGNFYETVWHAMLQLLNSSNP